MIKKITLFIVLLSAVSCTKEKVQIAPQNLQEYLNINSGLIADEVIACAASNKTDATISYIFYYPILGATEIQYFETESTSVDEKNFSLYKKRVLPNEDVFNGYLERYVRNDVKEVWSIITYKTKGKIHKSNPIRLKHQSKPTEWNNLVTIDFTENTSPKFSWQDGIYKENEIYFQVVANYNKDLLSGTYTYDKWFQYYLLDNVVLNVTTKKPPSLKIGSEYNFTMMGVSLDNWVNLVIDKQFLIQ
jgi:hypothetical protein